MELSNLKYHCSNCGHDFSLKEAHQENDTISLTVDLPGRSWPTNINVTHLACPSCKTIATSVNTFGLGTKKKE